jgi:hypothetical protein
LRYDPTTPRHEMFVKPAPDEVVLAERPVRDYSSRQGRAERSLTNGTMVLDLMAASRAASFDTLARIVPSPSFAFAEVPVDD